MLKGLRVLQFEGLAPSVFCGMYFADQGAQVILVARKQPAPFSTPIQSNLMNRGKKCIQLSLKIKQDKEIIQELIKLSNIIIDPFRPGVLQKLNLGPEYIYKVNKKAILLRVTGYGQQGQMAYRPGHDLNYISSSGIVPLINIKNKNQIYEFPTNYLADFVSCSLGITAALSALVISQQTGEGRIVDCSLTEGCRYFSKIISQTYDVNKMKEENQNILFVDQGQSRYCVMCKKQNRVVIDQIINRMKKQNKDYIKTQQIQISRVKQLSQMKTQIKQLKNPFDNAFNSQNISIPKKGQHKNQIDQIIKIHYARKSKL